MFGRSYRRVTGIYLTLFFLAVACAQHQHVNGLEDLLLDQRSDSGAVLKEEGPMDLSHGQCSVEQVIDDDPCLACFNNDFVSTTSPILAFTPHLERFEDCFYAPGRQAPWVPLRDTHSRAPPRVS